MFRCTSTILVCLSATAQQVIFAVYCSSGGVDIWSNYPNIVDLFIIKIYLLSKLLCDFIITEIIFV